MSGDDHKYKGTRGAQPREGFSRLRRANADQAVRQKGWAQRADDDEFLDRKGASRSQAAHVGENLLARFNRVARVAGSAPADAVPGTIAGFAGHSILVRLDDGREPLCDVRSALLKLFTGVRNPLVVGDRVLVTTNAEGGVIAAALPRRSLLARADSHNRALLHQLAANVDRLVVVASLGQPEFKPAFVDRYLLIAAASGVDSLLVLNKSDLGEPTPWAALYRTAGYDVVATVASKPGDTGLAEVANILRGQTTVFAGQSGVGKSSLINCLYPTITARIGSVADDTGLGRHTTTAARAYQVADGGTVIDTPGIRECGIAGITPLDVALLYRDLARHHHACHFNDCSHRHEPECAVRAAVTRGEIAATRYASYCAILGEDLAHNP